MICDRCRSDLRPPSRPVSTYDVPCPNCGKANAAAEVKTRLYVVGADSGLANTLVYIKKGLEGKSFPVPTAKPKPGTAAYCQSLKTSSSRSSCLKKLSAKSSPKAPTTAQARCCPPR